MVAVDAVSLWEVLVLVVVVLAVVAVAGPRIHGARRRKRRRRLRERLAGARGAKVLTLVHRKAPASLIGRPMYQMIDIDDAEAVLRGIRAAGDRPVDILLHTPGGMYPAALQIARALRHHEAPTRVLVPHMAMSGGTLIALGADEIIMDADAILGPVDPQVGDLLRGSHSVVTWRAVAARKGDTADDATLAFAELSDRLLEGTRREVAELMAGKVADPAPLLARLLEGGYAHAHPVSPRELQDLGLPVSTDLPREAYDLLETYDLAARSHVDGA